MKAYLWHERYGFVKMEDQWTTDTGARYGSFRADNMGIVVNLPLKEVMVTIL